MIKKEELKEILHINSKIKEEINEVVRQDQKKLYDDNLSVIQLINTELEKLSICMKFPIDSPNIGGFIYKNEEFTFCYINTKQIRVFQNFVSIHEYYHLKHGKAECKITLDEETSIDLEERKANYYASLMSLEENSLIKSYDRLMKIDKITIDEVLCYLIDLYKVPKKTILLRLHEIKCIDFDILYNNFDTDIESMKLTFQKLGLDTSHLEFSKSVKLPNYEVDINEARENDTMLESFIDTNEKYIRDILNNIIKEE